MRFEGCCALNRLDRNDWQGQTPLGRARGDPLFSFIFNLLKNDISKSSKRDVEISEVSYPPTNGTLIVILDSHFFLPFHSFIYRRFRCPAVISVLRRRLRSLLFFPFPFSFSAGASM